MFFYESDNQEVDIEWLSDPASQSNIDSGRGRALFYTNQAVTPGTSSTSDTGEEPADAFSAVHNYRVDWDGKTSTFYLDNKLQHQFKTNVPTAKDGHCRKLSMSSSFQDDLTMLTRLIGTATRVGLPALLRRMLSSRSRRS
jgi:hypothetical protein